MFRDYRNGKKSVTQIHSIHKLGFTLNDWQVLGIDEDKSDRYLKSWEYFRYHPINGSYSNLIDDKLVIKYIFHGTDLDGLMPYYYYLISEDGTILPMMDCAVEGPADINNVYELLKTEQLLALKRVVGSIGVGFYKVEYKEGRVFVNNEGMTADEFKTMLSELRDYLVCEYLLPHPVIADFWPLTPNTLRHLVGRVGSEWRIIKSFIRFGSEESGNVENFNCGGILCYVDENGWFENGYKLERDSSGAKTVNIKEHPDNKKRLVGQIPLWDEIQTITCEIERILPQTKYLGLDYVITDKNQVRLLEINSLSSLDALQLDGSILETENGKWFFSSLTEKY